jgi:PAS domain S-box-containing protein
MYVMQKIIDLLKLKTIYAKLLLSFTVIATLAFSLSAVSWLAINSTKNNFVIKKEFSALQKEVAKLQNAAILFLTQEQNNREYMRMAQSKYLDEYDNIQKNINFILSELQNSSIDGKESLSEISEQIKKSDRLFKQIIFLLNERGAGEYGLIGQLDNILAQLDRTENISIQEKMLKTALAEKIYLQSGSKPDQSNFKATIKELQNAVLAAPISNENKTWIRLTEDYIRTAHQLFINDSLLGTGRTEGLRQDFFQIIDNINSKIERNIYNIDKATDDGVDSGFFWSALFAILILIASTFITIQVPILVTKPLAQLAQLVYPLEKGKLISKETPPFKTGGDVGRIAQTIFTLNENLWNIKQVATEVGNSNFDNNVKVFEDEGDLGEALATMRNSLKRIAAEEKQRNWTTNGIAKFSEILRQNNSVQQLCHQIIRELCEYTKSCQGAVYLYEEQSQTLRLVHAHAYDQQRFMKKQINVGEGLIGACFLEKKYTILDDLPEDYHYIEMGLGTARPKCLILMPLQHADSTNGVIELASFQVFQPHEITFIEKIAESMSASLANINNNEKNAFLLNEARQQAEMMQAQEEEIRQTMEELSATQEEMERKNKEMERMLEQSQQIASIITTMPALVARCMYDENHTMIYVNQHVVQLLECSEEEILKKGFTSFIHPDDLEKVNKTKAESRSKNNDYQVTYRIITKNNTIKNVWDSGKVIRINNETYIDFFIIDLAMIETTQKA